MKKTYTQWTTTTRREARGTPTVTMEELEAALGLSEWDKAIANIERMPLAKAHELWGKLNQLFGARA